MQKNIFHTWAMLVTTLLVVACASIGSPDGGPRDYTPPYVVKCQPADQSTDNHTRKIRISFNEYIKLEKASEKVVVSPPQMEMPNISTEGKQIRIELYDSLRSNTTYTIDFSDAIVDNNEGNAMGKYTYSFSTGQTIDTLQVSGTVLNASNLEPIKGILVGLYSNLADSAFTTEPMLRVSRTNGSGQFTIQGVAPGTYRIYALQEADGNFHFNQKSEVIAFDTMHIRPSCAPDIRMDTIWKDSLHVDTIKAVHYTHFYPDDIVLRAFLEEGQGRYLLKNERPLFNRFTFYFTAPDDTLPRIQGFNFDAETLITEASEKNDTITYWIPDTTVANLDTLNFAITYRETDSLGILVPRTDTLELAAKISRKKSEKERQDKIEQWEKEQKKLRRKGNAQGTKTNPFLRDVLKYSTRPSGSLAPNQNITFVFNEPLAQVDSAALHFYIKKDTLWEEAPFLFEPVEGQLRNYRLYAEWLPTEQYKIEADSAAFRNIFGDVNNATKTEFKVSSLDEYSALFVKLELADTGAVVQLLNKSDKVVNSVRAVNNRADFFYIKPGEYYLRLFIDRNGDGIWNTGSYADMQQPEEVFYFPKPLTLRAKWEVEQDWDVRGIPLVRQKPMDITKQKPDKEKKIARPDQNR
ncbi:MAG: Ig-like domain-containing protein [Paraprevotella sp.]|nr:Ig-like domain-containing protein [Paraprevotella sp.]